MNVRELFPKAFEDGAYEPYVDYSEIVYEFGYPIKISINEDDYQGDSWYILKDGTRYGYLEFGWGSCSGCDALKACKSFDDLQKLADELERSIVWYESKNDLRKWLETHDFSTDWSTCTEHVDFLNKALELVGSSKRASIDEKNRIIVNEEKSHD